MASQVDLTPATNPIALGGPGIHFHGPVGASASQFNDPSSFPSSNMASAPKVVTTKITATPGVQIKFSNPA